MMVSMAMPFECAIWNAVAQSSLPNALLIFMEWLILQWWRCPVNRSAKARHKGDPTMQSVTLDDFKLFVPLMFCFGWHR